MYIDLSSEVKKRVYVCMHLSFEIIKKKQPKLQSAGSKKEEKKKKGKKGQSQGQQKSGRPVSGKQQLQQQGGTGQAKSVELILKPTAEIIIDGKKYSCINLPQKSSLAARNIHVPTCINLPQKSLLTVKNTHV